MVIAYTPSTIKSASWFKSWNRGTHRKQTGGDLKTRPPSPFKERNQRSEDSYITLAATEVNTWTSAGINVVLNYITYTKIYCVVRGKKLLILQAHTFYVLLKVINGNYRTYNSSHLQRLPRFKHPLLCCEGQFHLTLFSSVSGFPDNTILIHVHFYNRFTLIT